MPVDLSDAAAEKQQQGFVVRHNYVGSGQGTVVRIVEFAPGAPKFMHRTETLDYGIVLSGECDLELDDGKRCASRKATLWYSAAPCTRGSTTARSPACLPSC